MEELPKTASQVIEIIGGGGLVLLQGEMGAGKTTFTKALCHELGVKEAVNSPTFSIVNEYRDASDRPIYHFDFYRIKELREAIDLGFEEYVESGYLCIVEWPEKIEALLEPPFWLLRLEVKQDAERELTLSRHE